MIQSGLEVRLAGDEAGISATAYAGVISNLTRALEEIDRVVEPSAKRRPIWKVVDTDWREHVGASVRLAPHLRRDESRTTLEMLRPGRELWGGVQSLASLPEIPPSFSASIVQRVAYIRHQIKPSTGEASAADFSEAVEVNADRAVAAASLAYGSLSGRLDLISARGRRRRIGLRTEAGHAVMCDVDNLDQDAYMSAFAERVLVIGTIKRNSAGQAVSVMVDELEPLPDVESFAARRLLGALPDLGGDLSAVDYVRLQRGDD
jgi:hypothetical protein